METKSPWYSKPHFNLTATDLSIKPFKKGFGFGRIFSSDIVELSSKIIGRIFFGYFIVTTEKK
jgi:hypothetical protein